MVFLCGCEALEAWKFARRAHMVSEYLRNNWEELYAEAMSPASLQGRAFEAGYLSSSATWPVLHREMGVEMFSERRLDSFGMILLGIQWKQHNGA